MDVESGPCYTQSDIPDLDEAGESVIRCFQKLVDETEAIYVTLQGGVREESTPKLVEISNHSRIPTFSQAGSEEVKYGFLASCSQGGSTFAGRFNACTVAQIFNGAQPNDLVQRFESPAKIAINLKTAEIVGLYLRTHILAAADVFETIESPE